MGYQVFLGADQTYCSGEGYGLTQTPSGLNTPSNYKGLVLQGKTFTPKFQTKFLQV